MTSLLPAGTSTNPFSQYWPGGSSILTFAWNGLRAGWSTSRVGIAAVLEPTSLTGTASDDSLATITSRGGGALWALWAKRAITTPKEHTANTKIADRDE